MKRKREERQKEQKKKERRNDSTPAGAVPAGVGCFMGPAGDVGGWTSLECDLLGCVVAIPMHMRRAYASGFLFAFGTFGFVFGGRGRGLYKINFEFCAAH